MKGAIIALLPIALLGACATSSDVAKAPTSPEDQLIGCYAQESTARPTLRVFKDSGEYFLSFLKDAVPHGDLMQLKPVPEGVLSSKPELAGRVEALLAIDLGVIGVVKFREGAVFEGQLLQSDFYFLAPQVGGPLFKRECP